MRPTVIYYFAVFGAAALALTTAHPVAAQAASETTDQRCTPTDLKPLEIELRSAIVEIDQKLLYLTPPSGESESDALKVLTSQAKIGDAAIAKYDAWAAAFDDYTSKSAAVTTETEYLEHLKTVAENVRPEATASARDLVNGQREKVSAADAEKLTAIIAVCKAERVLRTHYDVATKLAIPPVQRPSDIPKNRNNLARADCIKAIEQPNTDAKFATCLVPPSPDDRTQGSLAGNREATSIPLPNRPLRPRGFTASFEGSKSDAEVTLQFANEYKRRSFNDNGQGYSTWGFSAGVVANGGALLDLDRDGPRNAAAFQSGFDRIGAGTKFIGSLSFHKYPWERNTYFKTRAEEVRNEVYMACIKDRGTNKPLLDCTGDGLLQWLRRMDDGVQTNKKYADKYSALYFGPTKGVTNSRQGAIITASLARPKLTYQLFDAGGTLGDKIDKRYWDFSLGLAGYSRLMSREASDLTGVISLTYKRDWRDYFASDENLDKKNLPVLDEGFVPAVELRYLWRGGNRFPATAFLPKFTLDFAAHSESVELPLLFLFGEKMDSSAGIKYTHTWHDKYDDGVKRPNTGEISLVYQKTFSLNPK